MSGKTPDLEQALILLDQVVEKSGIDDRLEREASLLQGQPLGGGDGWITHHLKLVKQLLENHKNAENKK
jgi:hypothetical protein|tara:strand:+ start:383 stop:589 length:207 start_codon:yes stop_codon:yes gene_type:complete